MRLVVADNASTDGTAAWLKANFPNVELLQLEKNYGFAEGYNQAIARVDTEFVVLLNQDVETENDWITPLVNALVENENVAAVQPKIKALLDKSKFEYAGAAGGLIDRFGYPFCYGRLLDYTEADNHQFHQPVSIVWASGACLLTRRSLYLEAGGLDADLFAHMEEIDLCWRFKNMGYDVCYVPDATVYHLGGGSLPQGHARKVFLNFRNNLALLAKNYNAGSLFVLLFVRFWLDALAAIVFMLKGNFGNASAVVKAVIDFYRRLGGWLRKRNELKKRWRTVNRAGFYRYSILWDYYIRKARNFNQLRR